MAKDYNQNSDDVYIVIELYSSKISMIIIGSKTELSFHLFKAFLLLSTAFTSAVEVSQHFR